MRSIFRAFVLAIAISPFVPDAVMAQPDDEFVEVVEAPPPPRNTGRRGRGWRNHPVVLGVAAVVLVVAIPLGVVKLVAQMRGWQKEQTREKEPWEIAMENAERERQKG